MDHEGTLWVFREDALAKLAKRNGVWEAAIILKIDNSPSTFRYLDPPIFEDSQHKTLKFGHHDKGQKEELKQFIEAAKQGTEMPISINDIFDTTLVTLAAEQSLRSGEKINIADLTQS